MRSNGEAGPMLVRVIIAVLTLWIGTRAVLAMRTEQKKATVLGEPMSYRWVVQKNSR
jgi:hypothetical protein